MCLFKTNKSLSLRFNGPEETRYSPLDSATNSVGGPWDGSKYSNPLNVDLLADRFASPQVMVAESPDLRNSPPCLSIWRWEKKWQQLGDVLDYLPPSLYGNHKEES